MEKVYINWEDLDINWEYLDLQWQDIATLNMDFDIINNLYHLFISSSNTLLLKTPQDDGLSCLNDFSQAKITLKYDTNSINNQAYVRVDDSQFLFNILPNLPLTNITFNYYILKLEYQDVSIGLATYPIKVTSSISVDSPMLLNVNGRELSYNLYDYNIERGILLNFNCKLYDLSTSSVIDFDGIMASFSVSYFERVDTVITNKIQNILNSYT